MRNRRFGVEIEHGNDGGTGYVSQQLRRFIPEWFRDTETWRRVGSDGSGVEVRTPPLQGPEGFKTLREVLNFLVSIGGYVTGSDGMHVHHDAPEFIDDAEAQRRLIHSWNALDDMIDGFVSPRRRGDYPACARVWKRAPRVRWDGTVMMDWRTMVSPKDAHMGRGDLNVGALNEHGTIEIRLHEGTLNADVAEAWVKFGQAFINNASRRVTPMQRDEDHEALLRRLRLPQNARQVLLTKQRNNGAAELTAA